MTPKQFFHYRRVAYPNTGAQFGLSLHTGIILLIFMLIWYCIKALLWFISKKEEINFYLYNMRQENIY